MAEKPKTLIVMCNGPSLRDQNFNLIKKHDSLGLNAAYRYYRKNNWWPKYFACFDRVVCEHHQPEYELLISNSPIDKFFFVNQHMFRDGAYNSKKFQRLKFKRIIPFEDLKSVANSFDEFTDIGCTGANAVQVGILLGYKKIILLGCDANYVEKIEGAETFDPKLPHKLQMKYTPKTNPNYWFDDYQREGDQFNVPKANVFHIPAWERLAKLCPEDVEIVNCSPITKVKCFRISTLEEEI